MTVREEVLTGTSRGYSVRVIEVEPIDDRSRWQKWVDRWSADLERVRDASVTERAITVTGILWEMDAALNPANVFALTRDNPESVEVMNPSNPAEGGAFSGDGKILLNMVLYAGAGMVISIILRYMGRAELGMIVLAITGFIVLRQFLFILKELLRDVRDLINL